MSAHKYHIKPLGMAKTQGFRQDLYVYDLFLHLGDFVNTSVVSHRANRFSKNPTGFD